MWGATALGLALTVSCTWTVWGVTELFHEGWYGPWPTRLLYLMPAAAWMGLTCLALAWPRIGGWLLIALGAGGALAWNLAALSRGRWTAVGALSTFPVSGIGVPIGLLFLLGARRRPQRARTGAFLLAIGLPVILGGLLSIEPIVRISSRVDDGNRGMRLIEGNGVALLWAPEGPGWERSSRGPNWHQARRACEHLDASGTVLLELPQRIWRLPSAEETVRSLVRHAKNAGCTWNGRRGRAPCRIRPDKETPLWDPAAPVIYLWTATEADPSSAYYVAYNGNVYVADKSVRLGSLGYRCVREP